MGNFRLATEEIQMRREQGEDDVATRPHFIIGKCIDPGRFLTLMLLALVNLNLPRLDNLEEAYRLADVLRHVLMDVFWWRLSKEPFLKCPVQALLLRFLNCNHIIMHGLNDMFPPLCFIYCVSLSVLRHEEGDDLEVVDYVTYTH